MVISFSASWLHSPWNVIWLAAMVKYWTPRWVWRKLWRWTQISALYARLAWQRLYELGASGDIWLAIMFAFALVLVGFMGWGIYESFQPQCTVVVTNTSGHAGHFGLWRCPNSWGFGGGWAR